MHVVSTSMSRRDLNFPTLSAPYRTPCLSPRALPRALPPPLLLHAYSLVYLLPRLPPPAPLLSSPPFPSLGDHAVRALHLPARSRIPVTTNTHVRVLRRPNGQRRSYARATAHDFSSMRPDLLRSFPHSLLSSPSLEQTRPVECVRLLFWKERWNNESRPIFRIAIPWSSTIFHLFRVESILLFHVGKGTDVFLMAK